MPLRTLSMLAALLMAAASGLLPTMLSDRPASGAAVTQDPATPAPTPADPRSAETCGRCHTEFYEEWHGRAHQQAWVDEVYQESLQQKERPEVCWGCHIPEDVHQRLGRKPKPRDHLRDEGVTCVSCHQSASTGDTVLGPFGSGTDAHPCEKNPAFSQDGGSNHLCASCHGTKILPVLPLARDHQTYLEKAGADGKNCVECHMPPVERHLAVSLVTGKPTGEKRPTRSHAVLGPRDPEFCAKAFGLTAEVRVRGLLTVSVENRAGHRIPGLTLREFVVAVTQGDQNGASLVEEKIVLSHENDVQALETREFQFDLRDGATTVTLRVDHLFDGELVATVLTEQVTL